MILTISAVFFIYFALFVLRRMHTLKLVLAPAEDKHRRTANHAKCDYNQRDYKSHVCLGNPDEQENAVGAVLRQIPEGPCVVMGDFNMEPDNPILEPLTRRLQDTAKAFSAPKCSFPSDRPTVKIDYIFVTGDVGVKSADIPPIISSDHRPHVAEIELGA